MSTLRIFAALAGCSLAALGAPIPPPPTDVFTELFSRSSQTVNNPLTVRQNLFSTQILAQSSGGQVVFDQTLPFAFMDPAVQALVAQGALALNGIGATSILGPTLISNSIVSEGSSVVTRQTGSRENFFLVGVGPGTGTTVTFGPGVVTIGTLVCESFAITSPQSDPASPAFGGWGLPSGCTGGTPYAVGDNETNFNTWTHFLTTNFQDVTTTETFRTQQVYLLQGQDAGPEAAVPEPGTVWLLIASVPGLAALRRRRRTN